MMRRMDELDHLRARIGASGAAVPDLAQRAGVKVRWLRHFLAAEIPEPGFPKVRRLQKAVAALERAKARNGAAHS